MATIALYDALYVMLSKDETILNLLGVNPSDKLKLAKRIQRRQKPVDAVSNLPLIAFYNVSGDTDRTNGAVFYAPFVFDVYTKDDVPLAHAIHNRIFKLLEGKVPNAGSTLTLEARFADGFESPTDLLNTYCYTQVFFLGISLEPEDR